MYQVSDAYKKARKEPVQRYRMTGTVDGYSFTDENILQGSFSITNQCSDESNVQIGQVYIAELKMTLVGFDSKRYQLNGKKIIPIFGMLTGVEGEKSYEDVPLGVYTISDPQHGQSGIEITAYDNMSKFDKSLSVTKLSGTPFELLSLACKNCKVTFGMSEADFDDIPNGSAELTLSEENTIETWRDVISFVAQICASNAFADREGRLILKQYNRTVVDEIDDEHRLSGCTFGGYVTRYTGLSVVDEADESTHYFGAEDQEDTGLTYNLGDNPFLQKDGNLSVSDMCRNILQALEEIYYVPFSVTLIGDPAYDLMDVLVFKNGIADGTQISCITKFDFVYNQHYAIEGVGQNPALTSRNSKTDKNLSGLSSKIESVTESANSLLYDYNTGQITIGSDEQIIASITFYVSQECDIEGHFLMTYSAAKATHLILRFYDTTVEQLFSPCIQDIIESGGGTVGIPHAYLKRQQGIHTLIVTAQCTEGSIFIDTRALLFTLSAGEYVQQFDDLTMDVRDLSMRQLQEDNGPDQIWVIGIEDGELLVARRDYSSSPTKRPEWTSVADLGTAVDAAIEFNGYWERRSDEELFTLITEDQPWYFWITEAGELIAQCGDDESTRITLDTGVSSISVCRGYKSETDLDQDQGLVALYIKDGHVWYRQYKYFASSKVTRWGSAVEVDTAVTDAVHCSVSRLNDYRLAVIVHSPSFGARVYITDRTYVQHAVPREKINFPSSMMSAIADFPKDYDTSINILSQTISEDKKTLTVTYDRLFRLTRNKKIEKCYEVGGILETDTPNKNVEEVSWTQDETLRTSTLTVKLKEPAESDELKYSFSVILNGYEGKASPDFQVKYDEWGYRTFSPITAEWFVDNTNYMSTDQQKETLTFPDTYESATLDLIVKGKQSGAETEQITFPDTAESISIVHTRKGEQSGSESETLAFPDAAEEITISYKTKNDQPI